ncbi:FG-GAP-like repeat-containing protein [Streptomyces flaveus]|uniref:FG-GAP repeat protein n=1 Tax=Streptomyces flaveus TaxID=66370 RepID=A0A917QQY4_9ACTN|nr:FG-GAP-like repeat-containing protein [Streptomyces flaveus]GGK64245.1 hypothetical protein GCM10010094_26440 [Streptomyces flaveus]
MKPQHATVLHGPLNRDGGAPRTTSTLDVGHGGWASIADTVVGGFDGDGQDDLVTKAEYDEEDVRFEEDMPDDVLDAAFYRGTAKGLKPAGDVLGITGGATPVAAGDFDGDGRDDILARHDDDEPIAVYGSDEGPGRGRPGSGGLGLRMGVAVAVGDSNGDGRDDIAAYPWARPPGWRCYSAARTASAHPVHPATSRSTDPRSASTASQGGTTTTSDGTCTWPTSTPTGAMSC